MLWRIEQVLVSPGCQSGHVGVCERSALQGILLGLVHLGSGYRRHLRRGPALQDDGIRQHERRKHPPAFILI